MRILSYLFTPIVIVSLLFLSFSSCSKPLPKAPEIMEGNWDSFNRDQINKMISQYGNTSVHFNADKPPYAVFDWDNTSIFLDIEEALMVYQLENLKYAMTPVQLDSAIRKDVPEDNFTRDYCNEQGVPLNINKVASDVVKSYTWIYNNYGGMKGVQTLNQMKASPQYLDFITKVRFLYDAIDASFSHEVSYAWILYLFTGHTEKEMRQMTIETVEWQKKQAIEELTWESPKELSGKAGVVKVSWKNGLRAIPEMKDLYATLRKAGFQVYVCSASFIDLVKEISSNPSFGYNNPEDHAIGMELERDSTGHILSQFRKGYVQTQGKGKTQNIQRFLVSKYGYGPTFVAGDSEGDQDMMQDFSETKLVLIINRLKGSDIGKLSKIATLTHQQASAKYLLQGRNDNSGNFDRSQLNYPLGSSQGLLLQVQSN